MSSEEIAEQINALVLAAKAIHVAKGNKTPFHYSLCLGYKVIPHEPVMQRIQRTIHVDD